MLALHQHLHAVLGLFEGGRSGGARVFQLDDVPAELALHRGFGHLTGLQREDCIGERLDHRVQREPAEVAAGLAGGVLRFLFGELGEIGAALQALRDRIGTGLVFDEDVPGVVFARQRGYLRSLFRNQLAVLKAIDDGTIDYGYLWANVGWTLHATPEFKLQVVPGYVPEDHWNVAIAMRKGDVELKRRVDTAIDKLIKDGTVTRALARYHVPHFAPFDDRKEDDKDGRGAADGIIRQPVVERGLEPQMQKLQTSRNPYGGLERVRSAGARL